MLSFKIPRFKPPSYTAPPQKLPVDQQDTESKNTHSNPYGLSILNVAAVADILKVTINHIPIVIWCWGCE